MTFGPLDIRFDDHVLRPRPWTLSQSTWAAELSRAAPAGAVLELCAGVGHIGLALAAMVSRDLVLVDTDPHACELAQANAEAAGLEQRVEIRLASVDRALAPGERFPLILADPPWVPSDGTEQFPDDPQSAIDGGDDGLDLARRCVQVIGQHLVPGGVALLQLGDAAQASAIDDHLTERPGLGVRVAEVRHPQANGALVLLTSA
jgi:release factor glutamine methyltransferase